MTRFLTTRETARLVRVSINSISSWIDQGKLKAGRTPGGHRRVAVADLIDFLHRQKLPVPVELEPPPTRILVVDDEDTVRKWISATIKAFHPDYEVIEASDGYSAGERVASCRPEVVILDLNMPGLDGFDACRRIKSGSANARTQIIAITGDHTADREKRVLECGARVCLPKPLMADDLLREVQLALSEI